MMASISGSPLPWSTVKRAGLRWLDERLERVPSVQR